jgi:hypothetical protein
MWGNLQGWIVAGVLFVIICFSAFAVKGMNEPTPPTKFGLDARNLAPLEISPKPATIVAMDAPGDAGELYRKAIEEVKANRKQYEQFLERGKLADARSLAAVKYVVEAAPMASMKLLTARPEQNLGYFEMATPEDLAAIKLAGKAVERVGLLQNADNRKKEAVQSFEASFALCAKLFNERLVFMQAFEGLGLMNAAAEMMKIIAKQQGDEKRVAELDEFLLATRTLYEERMKPMWMVISAVGGTPQSNRKMAEHTGDVYHFTSEAQQERLWRVESTLKLGRFKFHVGGQDYGRLADQTLAPTRLAALQNDPDPYVATAARAAADLTQAQYNLIK